MTLAQLRLQLAFPKSSWQLSVLSILAATVSALVIVAFRLLIERIQLFTLPDLNSYAEVSFVWRFCLPFLGVMAILFIVKSFGLKHYRLGIPFVIHRLKRYYGLMPWRSTLHQFFSGAFALAAGFVVGREGPSVHLGAASTGFIGRYLQLPYNAVRTLVGCGIAAGISASFNTPLAALIFVMEVVFREYRIHIFIPVMLSAAVGTVISRAVFGSETDLAYFSFTELNTWVYLYLLLVGIALGALGVFFNRSLMLVMRTMQDESLRTRLLLAAAITGLIGAFFPAAMGAEFSSTYQFFNDNPLFISVLLVTVAKALLAITALGLGVPGGIIGAVMVVGMFVGGMLGWPITHFMDNMNYQDNFLLLGLAGLLTAVLHAPLASLTAVMELSFDPALVLPTILVIVPAYVVSQQFFGNRSIFLQQLNHLNLPYTQDPVHEILQTTGVLALAKNDYPKFSGTQLENLKAYLQQHPTSSAIQYNAAGWRLVSLNTELSYETYGFKFMELLSISQQATLAEAYDQLKNNQDKALIVEDDYHRCLGVITWTMVQGELFKQG